MFESLFHLYAGTALSAAVRESRWIFAVFEMIHLTGLALSGGAILIASTNLLGWRTVGLDARTVWWGLRGVIAAGLTVTIASGVVLVGVNPLKYYFNPSFNTKIWLLLGTVLIAGGVDWIVRRPTAPAALLRAAAGLLAAAFLSVGLAGRAIGLL